jgi:hypothetical protein
MNNFFKIFFNTLFVIQLSYALTDVTVYEDAESNNTTQWSIYDLNPIGASIKNIYDDSRQSHVIQLKGKGTENGYLLRNSDGSWWYNTKDKIVQWSMNYAEDFSIYFRVKTEEGIRLIYYTAENHNNLEGRLGIYIHYGLGEESKNGTWQTFTRNLEEDLQKVQPNNKLLYIAGIYIRGSGRVDDFKTLSKISIVNPPESNSTELTSTLYVTTADKGGEYICDGVDDEVEINKALSRVAGDARLTTLYLKGKMECVISEPILLLDNIRLIGDANVTIKLKDNIGWNLSDKPLIGQRNSDGTVAWREGRGSISNIEIGGFELSGGIQSEPIGQSFIILINLYDPSNVSIHDMDLHDSRGDIIRFYGSNVGKSNWLKVYNNHIYNSGHEGIYSIYGDNMEIYNNKIYNTRTNSGIRISSGSNFSLYGNEIGNSLTDNPSGYAGILIDSSSPIAIGSAIIYDNYIYGKNGGIVLEAGSGFDAKSTLSGVHIHHNRLYKINSYSDDSYLNGAIRINGFHNTLIEFNTIEGSEKDGIVYDEHKGVENRGDGYVTIVRNNIISNSKGYGINNLNSSIHTFVSKYNDIYNSGIDNYNNLSSTLDIHLEPSFAHTKFESGWHYIVATYDGVTERFKIYIDGKEKANQQFKGFGKIGINSRDVSIGSYRTLNVYQLNGKLDDMAVWERALSQDEILQLWNSGQGQDVLSSNGLTKDLKAYWQMEKSWSDSFGSYSSPDEWSTATFSSSSKEGSYSALFNGENYTAFSNSLSPSSALTIATWVYMDEEHLNSNDIQTIFNKGSQESNDHIWLYAKGERFYFELGNGNGVRQSISASAIDPRTDLDLHLKSEYGRWSNGEWVLDTKTSLLIDQADPTSDYSHEIEPNGERANLGAYGNSDEASHAQ